MTLEETLKARQEDLKKTQVELTQAEKDLQALKDNELRCIGAIMQLRELIEK